MTDVSAPTAKERILATAYELFSKRAVRDVGVDELIRGSDVAIATFYRHFPSKNDVVLAFLQMREEVWTLGSIEGEARRRGDTPEEKLLAIFDVFDEWFHREDFEACPFVNILLEMKPGHPLTMACVRHLERIREMVAGLAEEAGLRDPAKMARSWHILMKGSIVSAAEGDQDAAKLAQDMARCLIQSHRG
ncbi:MAG: helix-turn-helix domain-containing protein [Cryobacterium sp.]